MDGKTKVQKEQEYLYLLFKEHILSLDGISLKDSDGVPKEYISKEDLMDAIIKFLNVYGEEAVEVLNGK